MGKLSRFVPNRDNRFGLVPVREVKTESVNMAVAAHALAQVTVVVA